ncbi:MAG: hypothetical protein AAB546_04725 [Patescibacteria group bacterium]
MSSTVKQIIVVALIVVLVVVVVIVGIRTLGKIAKNVNTRSTTTIGTQTNTTTTVDEGVVDLDTVEPKTRYSGKITISATVDEVLGVRAFVISSNDLFNKKMLIITEDGIAPIGAVDVDEYLIKKGDRLLITGKLDELTATTPNRKTLNIKTDNLSEWMNTPIIVASDIDRIK